MKISKINSKKLKIFPKFWNFQNFWKIFLILMNFKLMSFHGFENYTNDQEIKNHLHDQKNPLARTPRFCARKPRLRPAILEKSGKFIILWFTFFKYGRAEARFPRAQPRAHPCSARQWILLIMEMIFDPLIISIALKTMKRHQFEIHQNQKIFQKFWKFQKILKNFKISKIFEKFQNFWKISFYKKL